MDIPHQRRVPPVTVIASAVYIVIQVGALILTAASTLRIKGMDA